eukprot:SAG11_NODE_3975_length_2128_cov_344.916091_2_plen_142_part_00
MNIYMYSCFPLHKSHTLSCRPHKVCLDSPCTVSLLPPTPHHKHSIPEHSIHIYTCRPHKFCLDSPCTVSLLPPTPHHKHSIPEHSIQSLFPTTSHKLDTSKIKNKKINLPSSSSSSSLPVLSFFCRESLWLRTAIYRQLSS